MYLRIMSGSSQISNSPEYNKIKNDNKSFYYIYSEKYFVYEILNELIKKIKINPLNDIEIKWILELNEILNLKSNIKFNFRYNEKDEIFLNKGKIKYYYNKYFLK